MVEFLRLQWLIEKPAKKKVFICVPFSSVFALSDVDFCYDCSWKKNVVGAASDNFIYDLEKTSFSFEYYCSKSSHSIEGRFQVAWIIDLQKWLFSLIMHEHILFTFNRKNTDSRPYHWRKGLCTYLHKNSCHICIDIESCTFLNIIY